MEIKLSLYSKKVNSLKPVNSTVLFKLNFSISDPTDPEERMLQQLFPNMKPVLTNIQPSGGQFRKKSVAFTDQTTGAALPSFLLTYQGGLLFTEDEIYAIPSDFSVLSSSDC
jgi:hypothetical protein